MSKRLKKCTLCLRGADSDTDEPITHPGKRKKTITNSGQDNQKSLPCRQGDALGSNMAAVVATQRYSSIEVDNPAPKTSDEEDVEHTDVVQTKRRFKTPKLKSIRKIFKWRARKAKSLGDAELEAGVAGNLSKSSGELSQQEEDRLKPGSPSTTGLSLSHDSVFNPDQQKIPSPAFKPETTVSVENIPAGFTSELSAKLRLRAGSSSEDDGLGPTADVTLTTNDVLSEKNEPRIDSKRDSGILSMDDEVFVIQKPSARRTKSLNSSPLGDRKRKMFATKKSRSTTSSTDLDLDLIVSSSQLSNAAALHKRSVAPKARRASSRSRLSQRSVVSQSGLSITSEKLEDIAENPKSRTPPHVSTEHIAKKDRPPSVEISREIKEVKSISISSTQEKENEKIVKMERPSSVEISKEIKEVKSISISSTQKKENEKIVKMERPSSVEISKEIKELKSVSSTEENKEEKIRASPDKEFLSSFWRKLNLKISRRKLRKKKDKHSSVK
uniref:Uncharacterized protein YMR317W-like n=1 Tax=Saccoglossus kowalevskii TaxID=10224 RepID=A0ABM0MFJ7_SACKO|nr:PREDICTED: uncharacterized protein YMR317W-like [Saccoglossus kowalevskii]